MSSKSLLNPKAQILRYRNKKKHLFLIDKNVLIVMVPILINKDVFEPGYNNLYNSCSESVLTFVPT